MNETIEDKTLERVLATDGSTVQSTMTGRFPREEYVSHPERDSFVCFFFLDTHGLSCNLLNETKLGIGGWWYGSVRICMYVMGGWLVWMGICGLDCECSRAWASAFRALVWIPKQRNQKGYLDCQLYK